eukprot:6043158-Lingulodinium_polyedra.AAC.1
MARASPRLARPERRLSLGAVVARAIAKDGLLRRQTALLRDGPEQLFGHDFERARADQGRGH